MFLAHFGIGETARKNRPELRTIVCVRGPLTKYTKRINHRKRERELGSGDQAAVMLVQLLENGFEYSVVQKIRMPDRSDVLAVNIRRGSPLRISFSSCPLARVPQRTARTVKGIVVLLDPANKRAVS